jgi:MYXO-CTERM domain-containing protein
MPYAMTVAEHDTQGKSTLLFDNASAIDTKIKSSNQALGYPHPAPDSSGPGGSSNGGGIGCGCMLGGGAANPGNALAAVFALSLLRRIRRPRR